MARCEMREGESCQVLLKKGMSEGMSDYRCRMPDKLILPCPIAVVALTGDRSFAQGLAEYRLITGSQQVLSK